MATNWRAYYDNNAGIIRALPPVTTEYQNVYGIAYWQWANAYITENNNDPAAASVALLSNTVAGYAEISYFKSQYFD